MPFSTRGAAFAAALVSLVVGGAGACQRAGDSSGGPGPHDGAAPAADGAAGWPLGRAPGDETPPAVGPPPGIGTGGARGPGGADSVTGTGGARGTGTGGARGLGGPTSAGGSSGAMTGGSGGTTGAAAPPAPPAVRFAAIGDYGFDNADEAAVAKLIAKWNPDFVITTGDNSYDDVSSGGIDANVGKYFHAFIGNYRGSYGAGSATNRFWPAAGDHDWLSSDLGPYLDYFTLPGNERYYDVDLGLVHLYAVDSDSHEPDGWQSDGKQGKWLQQRLAASRACFDIVYFHHSPYSSGTHGSITYMRWPFAALGADAVMSGHDHQYERLQVDGIPYFVTGAGGAGLRPFTTILPESKARYVDKHGAMLVTADSRGITYEFWTVDGERVDSFSVEKSCGAVTGS